MTLFVQNKLKYVVLIVHLIIWIHYRDNYRIVIQTS